MSSQTLPPLERTKLFIVVIGLVQAVGLAAFFAFLVGMIYAMGGTAQLDMTQFGEHHLEFVLMWAIVPVITVALFYLLEWIAIAQRG